MKRTYSQFLIIVVFGTFNGLFTPWLFFFAVSKGFRLHGHQLWRDLVTRKPRLPSFSKAVATESLTSPLYKMTRYRPISLDHALRRPRYLSTGQLPSVVKDRMDQLPGRSGHCEAVRRCRHHPNRLRRLNLTLYLPLLPLPPLHLLSAPPSRVTWKLQVPRKHNMSTLITHYTPRTAWWLCLTWERYRSYSRRRCGSNTSIIATLVPPCLLPHRPASRATGRSVRGPNLPRGDSFASSMRCRRRLSTLTIACPVGHHLPLH
jgi:hypothetical protein